MLNINIEIADKRDLMPIFSFSVETTEPVLGKWPILKPQNIKILGSQPWMALELLRRGKDLTHSDNLVTVVVRTEEPSDSDWTNFRDEIAKLLEEGLDILPYRSAAKLYSMVLIKIQMYCPSMHTRLRQGQGAA